MPFHTLYALPPNKLVTLVVIDPVDNIPIGTFVVNSGGVKDDPADVVPNYPYTVCKSEVVLYDPALEDPPSLSQSPANSFLHVLTSFYATAFGGRPLPQLCMVCHGGSANFNGASSPTNPPVFGSFGDVDLGSVFLPFDLNSCTIVDGYRPAFDKATRLMTASGRASTPTSRRG